MPTKAKLEPQRILNLIRAIRQKDVILPGDKIRLPGEKPATYLGALEAGDIQVDYLQIHTFVLCDGVQVVLEIPSLNHILGKFIY